MEDREIPIVQGPVVILARHGQTESNRAGRVMGQSDSPLTDWGEKCAIGLAGALMRARVETILCSPLGRARRTAEIIGGRLRLPVSTVAELAELACGDWEGRLRSDVVGEGKQLRNDWWERPPGGESCADGEERLLGLLDRLSSMEQGTTVLMVGHASINRVFLKVWLGLAPDVAIHIDCPHDRAYVLDPVSGPRTLSAKGEESEGLLFHQS